MLISLEAIFNAIFILRSWEEVRQNLNWVSVDTGDDSVDAKCELDDSLWSV